MTTHRDAHLALSETARRIERDLISRDRALAVMRELVDNQSGVKSASEVLVLQLMQFNVATIFAYQAYRRHELTEVGNWIGWAFSSEIEDGLEVSVETARLQAFEEVAFIATWPELPSLRVMFFSSFFHYARARTAMRVVAQSFWSLAVHAFRQAMADFQHAQEQEALLGSHLLEWAVKEDPARAQELTHEVESWIGDGQLPRNLRALLCVSMSTLAGKYSTRSAIEWASSALAEFGDVIHRSTQLQLRATATSLDDAGAIDFTLSEMREVQAEQRGRLTSVNFERYAGNVLDSVFPLIRRAFLAGDYKLVIRALNAWYLAEAVDSASTPRILITVPFDMTGWHIFSPFHHQHVERDGQPLLEALTHYTNEFYGTAKTVAYADNSGLAIPERPGVPRVDSIVGLEATLKEVFCCADLDARVADPDLIEAQLVFPAECNPVQAIQLQAWNRTWPMASSLRAPLPDAPIRRALVWCGGGTMTEEMEANFVAHVLRSAGVEVEVVSAAEVDVLGFLRAYARPDLDLVWVISHGEFDHWLPHDVKLQISHAGQKVGLQALWDATPTRDSRRLLVLNVCDGGRYVETGVVPRVGLAPGLACPAQATISHLWPVLPFPSAAFGACLALPLAKGLSFFDSYTDALRHVQAEPFALAEFLRKEAGDGLEFPERLANRSDPLASMQLWGSAAFYQ